MAISYSPVAARGKVLEQVYTELLFLNKTVAENLVVLHDEVKADTIITEFGTTVTMQAYTSGPPSASGTITPTDKAITPIKVRFYDEFDPESLRLSRFKRDMIAGAANITSNEFNQLLITNLAPKISSTMESRFWNGATTATKTAVALLIPGPLQTEVGLEEQAYVAAAPTSLFDGVVTTMIYNNGGVGGRIKVTGTTITSANIDAEYAKVYAAIPSVVLNGNAEMQPFIYAPYSHKQLINIFNTNATYRDKFMVQNGRYFYNGVEIQFVPLPENCMIAAMSENIIWCTDLFSDLQELNINVIANNRKDMFYDAIMTIFAWIVRQSVNVLYVG